MKIYRINEFYNGLKIIQNGEPCTIIKNEFVKPGKGQAFNRVKFKSLISKKIFEKIFKTNDFVNAANVIEKKLSYLYHDRELWYFMDPKSFEQYEIEKKVIGSKKYWLIIQKKYKIVFWEEKAISITIPHFLFFKIISVNSSIKGNTTNSTSWKLASLSNGIDIKVPIFIQVNDIVKVDTKKCEYISRINKK
ncbi:elongation factor P [bacterium endosymbiont of Pedicinus badii]|uniref:elongation factor P n=1 Tax=bacterium endosymbiont of Pedicinus badii TaxID=1719126 RepID=UPI0009BA6146|nr:elongation factor P [bacterium endosymbiont of Pedicinus badii]OQM34172.1 hypothetical protein AOQ89_02430 [bacterium endosymbiont of Pedicinus badii]